MRKLRCALLLGSGVLGPALARAGEQDVKAAFLLQGGIGGILIGGGLYAGLLLAAVLVRKKTVLAALLAVCAVLYGYVEYWSFYFLAIATGFLRTHRMHYGFGELTTALRWVLVCIFAWGLAGLLLAVRLWQRRQRPGGR